MNPARALGSAVVQGDFLDHWLYWAGPILGGVAGALIYIHALGPAKEIELPKSYTTVATDEKEVLSLLYFYSITLFFQTSAE
jgi:aquaporin related protein